MTTAELYTLLELPEEVVLRLCSCAEEDYSWLTDDIISHYLSRPTAQEALEEIQSRLGEDPDGFRLLYLLLETARNTWEGYVRKGISLEIFRATMSFVPRFLRTHLEQHGRYAFVWGGWFWRELAMEEYRIDCMEYELVTTPDGSREVQLHIPSDADLSPASLDGSFAACRAFLKEYYPDWTEVRWYCDSWMMSPALPHLLPEGSNILAFQRRFDMLSCHEDSLGVLDWVFPPHREVSAALPETTSLQRRMKAWLLAGNKVGWTKAILREE